MIEKLIKIIFITYFFIITISLRAEEFVGDLKWENKKPILYMNKTFKYNGKFELNLKRSEDVKLYANRRLYIKVNGIINKVNIIDVDKIRIEIKDPLNTSR